MNAIVSSRIQKAHIKYVFNQEAMRKTMEFVECEMFDADLSNEEFMDVDRESLGGHDPSEDKKLLIFKLINCISCSDDFLAAFNKPSKQFCCPCLKSFHSWREVNDLSEVRECSGKKSYMSQELVKHLYSEKGYNHKALSFLSNDALEDEY